MSSIESSIEKATRRRQRISNHKAYMATNSAPTTIVNELLRNDNYANWSACIRNYLLAQDLWDVVESPTNDHQVQEDEASIKSWRKKNAAALHAIQVSCSPEILGHIKDFDLANSAWDTLPSVLQPQVEAYNRAAQEAQRQQFLQFLPLTKAINKGNLNDVKDIIHSHPYLKYARNPNSGMTALHLAIYAGHIEIAEELMQGMNTGDLEVQDLSGDTCLTIAALTGNTKVAKSLVERNGSLLYIANYEGLIPLVMACVRCQNDVAHYLYSVTPIEFLFPELGFHGIELVVNAINCKIFDIALDLVMLCPRLVIASSHPRHNTILTLSSIASAFYRSSQFVFWQRWIYPGIKQIYDRKLIHAQVLQLLRHTCEQVSWLYGNEITDMGIINAIIEAAKQGVTDIVVEMIRAYPDLIWARTTDSRDIFMFAIEYRQENIFNLIYGLDSRKSSVLTGVNSLSNNMLHTAGLLAPFSQLSRLSGAALQMQRELQWFKEVESLVSPAFTETRNLNGETPGEVFTANHKQLLIEGEKWMKDTATSFTVVGALIITIMFAAAFTVPGGNNQEIGLPIFGHEKSFKVFIISDAVALFASSTSVLMFLGILTSRYAEGDFLVSLPRKLIIGLSGLFFSIAAMMVAFCAALMITMDGQLQLVLPIILLASVPVTLFIMLQFPLLVQIFISTYGSIFNRKMKPWL